MTALPAFDSEVDEIQFVNLQWELTLATIGFQVASIRNSPAKIITITPEKIVCRHSRMAAQTIEISKLILF